MYVLACVSSYKSIFQHDMLGMGKAYTAYTDICIPPVCRVKGKVVGYFPVVILLLRLLQTCVVGERVAACLGGKRCARMVV